jgi:DNA-binding LytR/AlgR family response regulator
MKAVPYLLVLALALLVPPAALAQPVVLVETGAVRVCPVTDPQVPPDFSGPDCRTTDLWSVDPQGAHLWMEASLSLSAEDLAGPGPFGLRVAAKASSEAWVNGVRIGANGVPAPTRAAETPGRMDAIFYVPRERVYEGENTVVLRLSAMHGVIRLAAPMHYVAFGPYGDPTGPMVLAYWPSLITFGAFAMGFVFFGVTALRGGDREGSALVSAISLFAALQLLAEVSRSLYPYAYPMHELRLSAVLACSAGFGLSLNAYLLHRLSGLGPVARLARVGLVAAGMLAAILLSSGFDAMTGFSLLTAALAGLIWCLVWTVQRKPGAAAYFAVLAVFTVLLLTLRHRFIDTWFYYAAAGVLAWLFYRQALALIAERRRRRAEELRAGKLEAALARAREKTDPARIQLVAAGRVDYVPTDRIVQFKGAGDYVEVHFRDARTALYNGSLAGLEADLPASFLRVHRSHIVNTGFVRALERDGTGVGRLLLEDGCEVPVSRRIMPKVRHALAADPDNSAGADLLT